jgi:hypothetical protein
MQTNISTELKKVPPTTYNPTNQFGCASRNAVQSVSGSVWYSCRETFHAYFHPKSGDKGLWFGTDKIEGVAKIFAWVEDSLNLRVDQRSVIYPCVPVKSTRVEYDWNSYNYQTGSYNYRQVTDEVSVIYVQLSPFWLSSKARCYFVTIMLRAAQLHWKKGRSPLAALLALHYCRNTPRGTALFLNGYTVVGGGKVSGWVQRFQKPEKSMQLRIPEKERECIYFTNGKAKSKMKRADKEKLQAWVRQTEKKPKNPPKVKIPTFTLVRAR